MTYSYLRPLLPRHLRSALTIILLTVLLSILSHFDIICTHWETTHLCFQVADYLRCVCILLVYKEDLWYEEDTLVWVFVTSGE